MKLNDIHKNLKKVINLNNKKLSQLKISPLLKDHIDSFKNNINQTIKISKPKKIILTKNKKSIQDITLKKTKKINLKNIIKKQSFFPLFTQKITFFFKTQFKKPKIKIKKSFFWIFLIFLSIYFIIANTFLFFWYNFLKNSTLQNITQQNTKSYISFSIAEFLLKPFYFLSFSTTKNLYLYASTGKNTNLFLKPYLEIYTNYKNSRLFLTDILKENLNNIIQSYTYSQKIEKNLTQILTLNPNSQKTKQALKIIQKINIILDYLQNKPEIIFDILWDNKPQKYLILFQNNDELRATGGFPGSVGIIDFYKWKILNFKKEDIYSLEWNINKNYKNKISSPKGINQINPYFTLKDANYFSSYFQSANSINFFLQKGNYSFDWIIFINTNTINKILDKIWGVYFDKLNSNINSKNFNELFSVLVEAKTSKIWTFGTPKQILFDFSKVLEEKIKNNILQVAKIILEDIENRELAIINFSPQNNKFLEKLWLTGEIKLNNYKNFIYPIFTSISQNKSDRYLKIKYIINTNIKNNQNNKCDYITNFSLELKHNFNNYNKQRIQKYLDNFNISNKEKILEIQWNWNNKQFLRFIIPKGSIIQASNFINISKNKNTNLIEAYTNLKPQEKSNISFKYILKNQNCNNYNFLLLKQPWIKKYNLNYKLIKFWKQIESINLENFKKDFFYIEK